MRRFNRPIEPPNRCSSSASEKNRTTSVGSKPEEVHWSERSEFPVLPSFLDGRFDDLPPWRVILHLQDPVEFHHPAFLIARIRYDLERRADFPARDQSLHPFAHLRILRHVPIEMIQKIARAGLVRICERRRRSAQKLDHIRRRLPERDRANEKSATCDSCH